MSSSNRSLFFHGRGFTHRATTGTQPFSQARQRSARAFPFFLIPFSLMPAAVVSLVTTTIEQKSQGGAGKIRSRSVDQHASDAIDDAQADVSDEPRVPVSPSTISDAVIVSSSPGSIVCSSANGSTNGPFVGGNGSFVLGDGTASVSVMPLDSAVQPQSGVTTALPGTRDIIQSAAPSAGPVTQSQDTSVVTAATAEQFHAPILPASSAAVTSPAGNAQSSVIPATSEAALPSRHSTAVVGPSVLLHSEHGSSPHSPVLRPMSLAEHTGAARYATTASNEQNRVWSTPTVSDDAASIMFASTSMTSRTLQMQLPLTASATVHLADAGALYSQAVRVDNASDD